MHKQMKEKTAILLGAFMFLYGMISYSMGMNSQLRQLKQEVSYLSYELDELKSELRKLHEMESTFYDFQYRVTNTVTSDQALGNVEIDFMSNKLGTYNNVSIVYRTTYDHRKTGSYDYSSETWKSAEVSVDKGEYSALLSVPMSCNYELRLVYGDPENAQYEELPELDLYRKAEQAFIKDINIHDVRNDKVDFDVQVVQLNTGQDLSLLSAECNVYYGDEVIQQYDILKENEIPDRKEPKAQLEHQDEPYWFIIYEMDFSHIGDFDKSKVLIEVVLEDSIKNTYTMTRRID